MKPASRQCQSPLPAEQVPLTSSTPADGTTSNTRKNVRCHSAGIPDTEDAPAATFPTSAKLNVTRLFHWAQKRRRNRRNSAKSLTSPPVSGRPPVRQSPLFPTTRARGAHFLRRRRPRKDVEIPRMLRRPFGGSQIPTQKLRTKNCRAGLGRVPVCS